MAKRIYVADDELHIRTLIQTFLVNEGYEVETFEDGNSLFDAFHASCPDLIILDVMMPGMDGFALCTAIRRESRVPIIIVSAKNAPMDRVTGITLGSDDYMVKPFLPLELVARVKALFRRAGYIRQDAGETLVCANLSLDPRSRCMTVDGAHFSVTPTEFAFLQYLMERRGAGGLQAGAFEGSVGAAGLRFGYQGGGRSGKTPQAQIQGGRVQGSH